MTRSGGRFAAAALMTLTAIAMVEALTIPSRAVALEYDSNGVMLVVDLAAAGTVCGACAWALVGGRSRIAGLLGGASGAAVLADTLVGRTLEPSVWDNVGLAAGPLLVGLLALVPAVVGAGLSTRVRRLATATFAVSSLAAVGQLCFRNLFTELSCVRGCSPSRLLIATWTTPVAVVTIAAGTFAGLTGLALVVEAARRRLPAAVAGGFALALFVAGARAIALSLVSDDPARAAMRGLHIGVALGVLAAGAAVSAELAKAPIGRRRLNRLLGDLRVLAEVGLEDGLRVVTGEPSLRLAYRHPDDEGRWLTSAGDLADEETPEQRRVELRRSGEVVAVIRHSSASLAPDVLHAAMGPAATLALDNERLAAAVRHDLAQLRRTSAALVTAGDAERERIERDLHDGAQQGLVGVGLAIRLASISAPEVPHHELLDDLNAVLAEVRGIAHGIYPSTVASDGVAAALGDLVDAAAVPVELQLPSLLPRMPAPTEMTAYSFATETIANSAEAGASQIEIRLALNAGRLQLRTIDNGPGGASMLAGGSLSALRDRAVALAGTLILTSPAGGPTEVFLDLPAGESAT